MFNIITDYENVNSYTISGSGIVFDNNECQLSSNKNLQLQVDGNANYRYSGSTDNWSNFDIALEFYPTNSAVGVNDGGTIISFYYGILPHDYRITIYRGVDNKLYLEKYYHPDINEYDISNSTINDTTWTSMKLTFRMTGSNLGVTYWHNNNYDKFTSIPNLNVAHMNYAELFKKQGEYDALASGSMVKNMTGLFGWEQFYLSIDNQTTPEKWQEIGFISTTSEYGWWQNTGSRAQAINVGVTYISGSPSVYKTNGNTLRPDIISFNGFSAIAGSGSEGTSSFQLSNDGSTWKYFNSSWIIGSTVSESNSESEINDNIATYPVDEKLYVKTFLTSNGVQPQSIDQLEFDYDITGMTFGTGSNIKKNLKVTHL